MAHAVCVAFVIVSLGWALPVVAQYTQYADPGELAIPEPPSREAFDTAMTDARWRLGGLRLEPSIWLSDLRWIDDPGVATGVSSDVTATVGAGLHAYTRIGPDLVLAARVLPEYVWWKEISDRNTLNGSYGAGAFGFFSRLRLGLSVESERDANYLSTEVNRLVNARNDSAQASAEVDLPGRLALFGDVSSRRYRYDDEDIFGVAIAQLSDLERDQLRLRGGVKLAVSSNLRMGVGVESSDTEFVGPGRDRSSSGVGPMFELQLSGTKLSASVLMLWPDLSPEPDSQFVCFNEPLGYVRLTWSPRGALEWQLYATSDLVYSVRPESPYYRGERVGLAAEMPLGWRMNLRVFFESGTDDYVETVGVASIDEDRSSYGGSLGFELGHSTAIQLGVTQIEYDRGRQSNLRVEAGLSVGVGRGGWY